MSDMIQKPDQAKEAEEQQQLSQRLREAREYLGLSQEFVGDYLDIPRASISAMETGKRKVSGLELKQLARLYKVSVAALLGEDDLAQEEPKQEAIFRALYRTTRDLSDQDREQVLRFAQFLQQAGRASYLTDTMEEE
ncbi:MAG: helix-turn-helix domain-containing protein [Chloroflexota bacterium]|nr:helix-turn-helix domain-containing protein [Chloroflexota bacterium]